MLPERGFREILDLLHLLIKYVEFGLELAFSDFYEACLINFFELSKIFFGEIFLLVYENIVAVDTFQNALL